MYELSFRLEGVLESLLQDNGKFNIQKNEKMGKEAVKIAKLDVGKLFNDMNVALAEEWLVDFFWRRENLFKEKERV